MVKSGPVNAVKYEKFSVVKGVLIKFCDMFAYGLRETVAGSIKYRAYLILWQKYKDLGEFFSAVLHLLSIRIDICLEIIH